MIYLTPLILAHLIGDFLLQPDAMVRDKKEHRLRSWYLYLHIAIHGLLAGLFTKNWIIGALIAVSHLSIDAGKLLFTTERNARLLFLADQVLHLFVIAGIVLVLDPKSYHNTLQFLVSMPTVNFACCVIFLTLPASIIIKVLISGWAPNVKHGKTDDDETPLMNAGKYIGMLERLFVFGFVVTAHFDAIGFLLAAKSIFRFGDLKDAKDRNLTEYVLIGTLLSFGFAIAAGWVYASGPSYFSPK